jgi:iron-sulfur cluster assembly protein
MLTITEKAAARAREVLADKGLTQGGLRVFVVSGGCAGYQYGMALAQHAEQDDLVVDPDSALLLEGAEIDYVDDLMRSGFTISNPNAVRSCACGHSFKTASGGGQARPCH